MITNLNNSNRTLSEDSQLIKSTLPLNNTTNVQSYASVLSNTNQQSLAAPTTSASNKSVSLSQPSENE